MQDDEEYLKQAGLFIRYLKGELSGKDREELEHLLESSEPHRMLLQKLSSENFLLGELNRFETGGKEEALERIVREAGRSRGWFTFIGYRFVRYAAVLLLIAAATAGWWLREKAQPAASEIQLAAARDILPGGNKAVLTLADRRQIELDKIGTGEIARLSNVVISKTGEGSVVYQPLPAGRQDRKGNAAGKVDHTIATPKGGQYRLQLPDGTRVWLNAASSLRFPATFGENERAVTLTGEAYFEVAPLKQGARKMPFKVISEKQTVVVRGTHFNINSYTDEQRTTTTLLEGKVDVFCTAGAEKHVTLQPGQQAAVPNTGKNGAAIRVETVDTEEALAWKNGNFQFRDADLASIMRQIARWYDVDVEFRGAGRDIRFRGKIPREIPLSQVFEILKSSDINFKIEGKKIIING